MDEEKLFPDIERQLLSAFEQSALHDFPNPDRNGCPGADFLRTLATNRKSVSLRDPRLSHVTHCSPCFKEFAAFRAEAEKRHRRSRLTLIAASVILVSLALGGYLERDRLLPALELRKASSGEVFTAENLDLKDWSVVRGTGEPPPALSKPRTFKLAHRKLDLSISLPFASDSGEYEFQVARESDKPLVSWSGAATIQTDGTTLVRVKLDLSTLTPGKYFFGFRRVPWEWTFQPVVIQ
jgi:hypothetical protein